MSFAPVKPSRARATLALALVFAAGFASVPWRPVAGWFLGVVVIALVLVLGSWGGLHLTAILRRRIALSSRKRRDQQGTAQPAADVPGRVAALIRVDAPAGAGSADWLPLPLIAGYLNRYGVRCAAVRVAFLRVGDEQEAWITLVVDAEENLAALRARAPQIQLHELAEAHRRRLAAQLREEGFAAEHADAAPSPLCDGFEDWNGLVVGEERVAAYKVLAGGDLDTRLASVAAYPAHEIWTVLEFTGPVQAAQGAPPELAVECVLRKKGVVELLPAGLQAHKGDHLPALAALAPSATGLFSALA